MYESFEFELYRLNIVPEDPFLFKDMYKEIKTDHDIMQLLKEATKPKYKKVVTGRKHIFEWAVREFCEFFHERIERSPIYGITLAKSIIETTGEIVTDNGIEEGVSESEPPIADTCKLFFYMQRHLVIIERRSYIINSGWRGALEQIFRDVTRELNYIGTIEFEPIPLREKIMKAFKSFDNIIRMRVVLRLPNPELSRYAAQLYKEMEDGKIREYLQDMRNPRGLSKEDGKLPHASIEIASEGYKKGELVLEGIKDQKRKTVRIGRMAARGQIQGVREFVRGMNTIAKTKEAKKVTTAILDEIDRIAIPPDKT